MADFKFKSGYIKTNGFIMRNGYPVDKRIVVDNEEHRNQLLAARWVYPGMIVYDKANKQHYSYEEGTTSSTGRWVVFNNSSGGGQTVKAGNVTFGPTAAVNFVGSDNVYVSGDSDAAEVLIELSSTPTFSSVEATSFTATSDARLKENFAEYTSDKSILDLPVYTFDFIDGAKNQLGCKAQDLQKICPEIVVKNEDGHLSIQESKIVYLLLNEIKKLKLELNVLKQRGSQ